LENDTTTGDELLREVMTDDPYVVLGFNVANVPVDVSNWGACVLNILVQFL
jgi:hypothetical protein